MGWFVARRLLLTIPGLLGMVLIGFVLLCVAAEFGPAAGNDDRAFRRHFGLEKPALANTRFALSARHVRPLVDDTFRAETIGYGQKARRAAELVESFGRDGLNAMLAILSDANADAKSAHDALVTAFNAGPPVGEEAAVSASPLGDEVAHGVATVLATPAILALIERPGTRDQLSDPSTLRQTNDPFATWALTEARDVLDAPAVRVALQRPDVMRALVEYGDARRFRRHVADWVLALAASDAQQIPFVDESAYLAQLAQWNLFDDREQVVETARQRMLGGQAATISDALVQSRAISPKVDHIIRRDVLAVTARDGETAAQRKVQYWGDWYAANAARFVHTDAEIARMVVLDTRLAAYLGRVMPDPERLRFAPDLGTSAAGNTVWYDLLRGSAVSLILFGLSLVVGFGAALLGGVASEVNRRHATDRAVLGVGYGLAGLPVVVLALWAVHGLSGFWPVSGLTGGEWSQMTTLERFWDAIRHLVLPVAVLGAATFALVVGSTLNRLRLAANSPHVITARARGLDEWTVIGRYALRPAMISLVAGLGEWLPKIVAAQIVVEWLFRLPGSGAFALDSVIAGDFPVILGAVLLGGTAVVLGRAIADIAAQALDPSHSTSRGTRT